MTPLAIRLGHSSGNVDLCQSSRALTRRAVSHFDFMPAGIAVKQFAGIDGHIPAEGLHLVVEEDQQLVVLDALDAGRLDDDAVNVRVIDLATEGPSRVVRASQRRV